LVDILAGCAYLPIWGAGVLISLGGRRVCIQRSPFVGKDGDDIRLGEFAPAGKGNGFVARLLVSPTIRWAPSALQLLAGKLSVVGPAPCRPSDVGSGLLWQIRQSARPGITGWAAINGCAEGPEALAYDLYYVRHRSLGFDLAIALRTAASPILSWRAPYPAPQRPPQNEIVSRGSLTVHSHTNLVSAYREQGRITASLSMLSDELAALGFPYEIIVVSDGNTDGTEAEARSTPGPVTVIHYPTNRGKGYAIRRGLAETKGDRVVFIDADMELHPQGIGTLLTLLDVGADVAIGSKRHPDSRVHYPMPRRIQSWAYQALVRRLFGLNVTDTQTGIKAFRGDLIRAVAPNLTNEGFSFDLELLVTLTEQGATIAEGPVMLNYRFASTTGVGAAVDVLRETMRLWHQPRRRIPVTADAIAADSL
jgi:hypothetical protein